MRSFREVASFSEKTVPLDYVVAISNAATWWPEYSDLVGWDACNLLDQREVFSDLPDGRTFARTPEVDPTSRALAAPGAQVADAQEFRMCGEMGALEPPFLGSSYEVWELPGRRIATVRSHKWHAAGQLGPQARSDLTNYLKKAGEAPSAIHRSPLREELRFLHAPFQIGVPA